MKRVITTVGTSLFTNYMKKGVRDSNEFRDDYREIDTQYEKIDKRGEGGLVGDVKTIIKEDWLNKFRLEASAEISSLLRIAKIEPIEVYLIATDTLLSVAACELIRDYLKSEFNLEKESFEMIAYETDLHRVKGLQVNDSKRFEEHGFLNLVEVILKIKNTHDDTVLNISGGYKALIPPLTIASQLYGIPLFYLYEDSDELIEIGTMPIGFDWFAIEKYSVLLHKTPQARQHTSPTVVELVAEMRNLKLVKADSYDLTILGNLLKQYLEKKPSPYTGTMMGYLVEHKLYKYFEEKCGKNNVTHGYEPTKGKGDIDLKIETKKGFIPIEIKPGNVCDDGFGTWNKLLKSFPERITTVKPILNQSVDEIWLILYGEQKPESDFFEMAEALKQFNCAFKVFFLKIKPSKLNKERHIYQDFFKNDIKESMIEEIYQSNHTNHV